MSFSFPGFHGTKTIHRSRPDILRMHKGGDFNPGEKNRCGKEGGENSGKKGFRTGEVMLCNLIRCECHRLVFRVGWPCANRRNIIEDMTVYQRGLFKPDISFSVSQAAM